MFDFTAEDLEDMGEIGRGNFGSVNKMVHMKTNTVMAVKVFNNFMLYFSHCINEHLICQFSEDSFNSGRERTKTTVNGS